MPRPSSSLKTIDGTSGDDTLYGDSSDSLHGHGRDQIINGLEGNDRLFGDAASIDRKLVGGDDQLNGGAGND